MSARCSITYFRYLHRVWHNDHYCLASWSYGHFVGCGHGDTRRGGITYLRYLDSCVSLSRLLCGVGQVWPGRHGGGGGGDGAQIGGATSGYKWLHRKNSNYRLGRLAAAGHLHLTSWCGRVDQFVCNVFRIELQTKAPSLGWKSLLVLLHLKHYALCYMGGWVVTVTHGLQSRIYTDQPFHPLRQNSCILTVG